MRTELYNRVVLAVLALGALVSTVITVNSHMAISTAIIFLGIVFPLALLGIAVLFFRTHPGRPQQRWWLISAFVIGMLCFGPAVELNSTMSEMAQKLDIEPDSILDSVLYSPMPEETIKGIAIALLVAGFIRVHHPVSVGVVGAVVGFGFAGIESALFINESALRNLNSDLEGGGVLAVLRLITGLFGHSLYSGLVGFGIGLYFYARHLGLRARIISLIGMWLLSVVLHTLSNIGTTLPDGYFWLGPILSFLLPTILGIIVYRRSGKIARTTRTEPESESAPIAV